jgi:rhamnose transport system permease protein
VSTAVQGQVEAADGAGRSGSRLVEVAFRVRELGILAALALVVIVTTAVNPRFLSAQSIRDLLLNASIIALLTVGQTLVVVTRNVDLSVGSVLGLTAFMTGTLFVGRPGLPVVVAVLAGVAVGAVCGAVNGAVTAVGKVPSLVVTLGTLYVFRGIDYAWAGGRQINAADLPDSLLTLGSGRFLGIPYLVAITVVLVAVAAYALRSYRSGRELYAIGPTPTPPCSPASRSGGGCSPPSCSAGPWPAWPGCCSPPATARSTPPPAPASSSRSSPRSWSAGWRSSAAAARWSVPPWAPCC